MGSEVFWCKRLQSWENKIVDTGHEETEENPSEKGNCFLVRIKNALNQPKNEELYNPWSKMSNSSYGILPPLQVRYFGLVWEAEPHMSFVVLVHFKKYDHITEKLQHIEEEASTTGYLYTNSGWQKSDPHSWLGGSQFFQEGQDYFWSEGGCFSGETYSKHKRQTKSKWTNKIDQSSCSNVENNAMKFNT